MAFRQQNTKLILKLISTIGIYFYLTFAWKALHAETKDKQKNRDMYYAN